VEALAETISPTEEPSEQEIESASALMALQQADWLGLVPRPLRCVTYREADG
jgi:hypothetical protein